MLQQMIEYLVQNPDLIDHVKEGTVSLIGVSEIEKQAIMEVFKSSITNPTIGPMDYWQ